MLGREEMHAKLVCSAGNRNCAPVASMCVQVYSGASVRNSKL